MVNAAKDKGSQFERDVVACLNSLGFPLAERRYGAGAQLDKGDINLNGSGKHRAVIEAKNLGRIDLSSIMDETELEKKNADAAIGVAIIKRRQRGASQAYCVMTLADLGKVLRWAGF